MLQKQLMTLRDAIDESYGDAIDKTASMGHVDRLHDKAIEMTQTVDRVAEWAKQYVSDEELAMQDAEALRAAGDELAKKAKQASQFVAKYVADHESVIGKRALDGLWVAIEDWREATGSE